MEEPGCGRRILVVEDADAIRKMLVWILAQSGFEVLEAADGAEALHILENDSAAVQLVITDMLMPRMGGVELARHLASVRPGTPVIFISGYTDNALVQEIARSGAAFLPKPFTASALAETVRRALEAHHAGTT